MTGSPTPTTGTPIRTGRASPARAERLGSEIPGRVAEIRGDRLRIAWETGKPDDFRIVTPSDDDLTEFAAALELA